MHICPIVNQIDYSHGNYEETKKERDDKEQQITHQLNQSLNLGLKEPSLEQIIGKIQELINNPPETVYSELNNGELEQNLNQAQQTNFNLERQLKEQAHFGENLETIKQLELQSFEQLLPNQLDKSFKQQIQQATNYRQLVSARQAFLQKHLKQNTSVTINQPQNELIQQPARERIVWIGLLLLSLLSVGGLLVKLRTSKR